MIKTKKILTVLVIVFIITLLSFSAAATDAPSVSAKSAILTDETGNVLFEKNPDERMLIASTTKIMTALVVLENCSLNESLVIEPKHTAIEGSSMYLKNGEEITVRELLYGLLLSSGNDAATALAYHVSGSIDGFVKLMNEKAEELGLQNTSFENPHGLDGENHYSTSRDLAIIMSQALKNEEFIKISSTRNIKIGGRTLVNHNKLLSTCDGVNSGKTGFTKKAGRTLVSSCSRNGLTVICVTLNDPDDWNDHLSIYEWAFAEYKTYSVTATANTVKPLTVVSGKIDSVKVVPEINEKLTVKSNDKITTKIILPKFVYAPVKSGETAGRIEIYTNGKYTDSVKLVYSENVSRLSTKRNIFRVFN